MKLYQIYIMPSEKNLYFQSRTYRNYKNARRWCEEYFKDHPEEKGYIKNQNDTILKWYNKK